MESIGCVEIDQGYLTEEMITDPGEAAAELEYPYILLTDKVICHSEEIVPAMNIARKDGKPLFIMAQDVTGEALATLVVNIRNGKLRSAAVKATAYGERRRAILQDVAVMTGAAVVSEDFGDDLKRISREFMGGCDSLKVNAGHTLIYGGKGKTEDIKKRTDRIRAEIRTSVYEVDRINLRNRLARMEGGVSIINVGADTETEMREKRQRIKSSVALVKAILRQGAVAGGGISLYRAACELYKDGTAESTEKRGAQRLLKEMLQAPLRQLLLNSGYDAGQILKALDGLPWEYGFDVMRGRYTDMFEAGITDAAGTMCRAVETAISLAGTVITAGAVAELET